MKRKLLLLVLVFIIIVCLLNSNIEYFDNTTTATAPDPRNILGDMYPGPDGKLILFPGDDGVVGYDYSDYDEKKSFSEMYRHFALYAPYFFDYYFKLDRFKNLTVDENHPTIEEKTIYEQLNYMYYLSGNDFDSQFQSVSDNMLDFSSFNPGNKYTKKNYVSEYYFLNIIRHHLVLSSIARESTDIIDDMEYPALRFFSLNLRYINNATNYRHDEALKGYEQREIYTWTIFDTAEFENVTYLDKLPIPKRSKIEFKLAYADIIKTIFRNIASYYYGIYEDPRFGKERLLEAKDLVSHRNNVARYSIQTFKQYERSGNKTNQTFVGQIGAIPALYIFSHRSRLVAPEVKLTEFGEQITRIDEVSLHFTYNKDTIDNYKKMYDNGLSSERDDFNVIYNPYNLENPTKLEREAKENKTSLIFYPYKKSGRINTYNYSGTSLSVYNSGYSWTNIKVESIINKDIENSILAFNDMLKIDNIRKSNKLISIFNEAIKSYTSTDDCIQGCIRKYLEKGLMPDFGEIVYNNHNDLYTGKTVDTSSNPLYLDVYFYNYIVYNSSIIPYFYVDYRKNLRLFIIYINSPDFVGYMTILDAAKKLLLEYMAEPPDWPYSQKPLKKEDPNAHYKFDNGNFAAFKTIGDRKLKFYPYF